MRLTRMGCIAGCAATVAAAIGLAACKRLSPPSAHAANPQPQTAARPPVHRLVRATGSIQPVNFFVVQVPQLSGQGFGRFTLTKLVPNGTMVKKDDLLAEFDQTQQVDSARDAQAKYDDLAHQVEQRQAQNRADAARRVADLQRAEADLAKAEIQLRKGPLLAEIERLQNEAKAAGAREHVASLKKSNAFHDSADAAALKILSLQRDRQKVNLERTTRNLEKMRITAPLAGMVALDSVWRNNSLGPAQEGDQLYTGQTLLRIFDPKQMLVLLNVGEPDGAALVPGARAEVRLDAYPDLPFSAHFESASPAAVGGLGNPIKTFAARFRLDRSDAHLLPDLAAGVVIEPPERKTTP